MGGLGRDLVMNLADSGQIWGDVENSYKDAANGLFHTLETKKDADGKEHVVKTYIQDDASNADLFVYAANTVINDAQHHDVLTFNGLTLTGGNDEAGRPALFNAANDNLFVGDMQAA